MAQSIIMHVWHNLAHRCGICMMLPLPSRWHWTGAGVPIVDDADAIRRQHEITGVGRVASSHKVCNEAIKGRRGLLLGCVEGVGAQPRYSAVGQPRTAGDSNFAAGLTPLGGPSPLQPSAAPSRSPCCRPCDLVEDITPQPCRRLRRQESTV